MIWIGWLLYALSLLMATALGCWLAYLLVLALVSAKILARGKDATPVPGAGPPTRLRLAVLIPAHNEEHLIARTVSSVVNADYPEDARRVLVVADNCDDDTAQRAAEAGAQVVSRHEPELRGKTHAMAFGLKALETTWEFEAVVFIDADCRVDSRYLERVNAGLLSGAGVVQGCCLVEDPQRTWFTRLTAMSFDLKNFWQFPALSSLSMAFPLRGACLTMETGLLRDMGFSSDSLTEDFDLSIRLMEAGEHVLFDPWARLHSYMPPTPASAGEQRLRWSRGEAHGRKHHLFRLLKESILHPKPKRLLECLYLAAPPLSANLVLCVGSAILGLLALFLGAGSFAAWLSLWLLAAYAAYFLLGLTHMGFTWGSVAALGMIPIYGVWRIGLHFAAMCKSTNGNPIWRRTPRV